MKRTPPLPRGQGGRRIDCARIEALQAKYRERPKRTLTRLALDAPSDGRLTGTDLRVLIVMGRYADSKGERVYPSVATVGRTLGVHPRNVRKSLRHLESLLYLSLDAPGGGRRLTNTYRVLFAPEYRLQALPPGETGAKDAPVSVELERATSALGGGQLSTGNPGISGPETRASSAPRSTQELPTNVPCSRPAAAAAKTAPPSDEPIREHFPDWRGENGMIRTGVLPLRKGAA